MEATKPGRFHQPEKRRLFKTAQVCDCIQVFPVALSVAGGCYDAVCATFKLFWLVSGVSGADGVQGGMIVRN
jgi:hypothetical protein